MREKKNSWFMSMCSLRLHSVCALVACWLKKKLLPKCNFFLARISLSRVYFTSFFLIWVSRIRKWGNCRNINLFKVSFADMANVINLFCIMMLVDAAYKWILTRNDFHSLWIFMLHDHIRYYYLNEKFIFLSNKHNTK